MARPVHPSDDPAGNPNDPDAVDLFDRVCLDFEDRYEFLDPEPFGRGGQAEVHRVLDRHLQRVVALKLLPACGPEARAARARFQAEARITAQLQHPGFLPVLDSGLDPFGRPFYTTYLLSGRSFHDLVRELHAAGAPSELPFRRGIEVLERICQIVGYAHSQGVFHRDLKPNNILLGHFGEVFVIDMGAAYVGEGPDLPGRPAGPRPDPPAAGATGPDSFLDTSDSGRPWHPLYSPPEVVRGELVPDERTTDLYALGVMLYELCSGRRPYCLPDGSLPARGPLTDAIRAGPPRALRAVAPWVARDLAAVAEKAMHRDATGRYRSVADLAADLRAYLETRVVRARNPGRCQFLAKWMHRHARGLAVAAVVSAGLGVAVSAAWTFRVRGQVAGQLNLLGDAQRAARIGDWSRALDRLGAAEAAGYTNRLDLGLQRYEAWLGLANPKAAQAVLDDLERLPDPGPARGAVLLRRAEYELFSPATFERGLGRVQEALRCPLGDADRLFAEGLLAPTPREALTRFHQALEKDPFHHGAHRLSLGFEFLLARNERLESHASVMHMLYPRDPSPVFLQACRLALDGRAAEAEALGGSLRASSSDESWRPFAAGLSLMGRAGTTFDLAAFLGGSPTVADTNEFMAEALGFFAGPALGAPSEGRGTGLRVPQLPCIKGGLEQGMQAILGLAMPLAADPEIPLRKLRAALAVHPEGLLPLVAASIRESRRPADPAARRAFSRAQADLLQGAADVPSILPGVPALARFLALIEQRDLAGRLGEPDEPARGAAATNLQWFVVHPRPEGAINHRLFDVALELRELDAARVFLGRWGAAEPADPALSRARIEVEMASRAFPRAWELVRERLSAEPGDAWAREAERAIREAAVRAAQMVGSSAPDGGQR